MSDINTHKTALLLLQDGTVFEGFSAGYTGTAYGEICFNTGMTGYQEVFTDPSYFGQILVETNVHVGNYGIKNDEIESDGIRIAGMVCRNYNIKHSRRMGDKTIDDYFTDNKLVAISNVDTRSLVRHIRNKGAMNSIISSDITDINTLKNTLVSVPTMAGLELASKVTTTQAYEVGSGAKRIALLDFGVKKNIIRCLVERGCTVRVFPSHTAFNELKDWNPDGYMLSNGPGDPAAMPQVVVTVKSILEKSDKPVFGICLGNQLLALANGIPTYKMHNGHRGLNHPVKNLLTGHSEITSQNHGFTVDEKEITKHAGIEITHINLNDNTIEGFRMKDRKASSVQYHPESSPGPHDSRYLFDDFVNSL